MDWVISVATSVPDFENKSFVAVRARDQPKIVRKTVSVFIPGRPNSTAETLEHLQEMNLSLKTELWRVYNREDTPKGYRLVLGVDLESLEALGQLDNRPFYELSRVPFWVVNKAVKELKS